MNIYIKHLAHKAGEQRKSEKERENIEEAKERASKTENCYFIPEYSNKNTVSERVCVCVCAANEVKGNKKLFV